MGTHHGQGVGGGGEGELGAWQLTEVDSTELGFHVAAFNLVNEEEGSQ